MSSLSGAKGSSGQVQRLSRAAVAKVNEVLQDPEVRDKAMENGRTLLDLAQQWREDRRSRKAQRDGPTLEERLGVRASQWFGVGRLRSRVDRLGKALDTLCSQSPDLADALGDLRSEVEEIRQRTEVADAFSGRSRRKMLNASGDQLDALEEALADALLPSPGDSE